MQDPNDLLFWRTIEATATLLAVTALPVFLSRQRVLIHRWLVWAAIAGLVLLAWMTGPIGLLVLATATAVTLTVEFMRLYKFSTVWTIVAGVVALAAALIGRNQENLALVGAPILFVAGAVIGYLAAPGEVRGKGAVVLGLAFVWLIWCPLFLQTAQAAATLFVVACFDVAAWVGGRFLAKGSLLGWHFAPKASPNKTLAGLLAGALAAALAMAAIGYLNVVQLVVILVLAVTGDYLESRVKRSVGVKDAANWLPGFGGLFDRLDSLLLLLPLTSAYSLLPLFGFAH